jgi:pimeloyl-ACP methyl ester carboxylesterase
VVVWGGSYGTYWAQRYLALFPDQADAVSLFGIAHPSLGFNGYDATYDAVGLEYLSACGSDAFCSQKLGPDPVGKARSIMDQLDAGHCAQSGLDRRSLQGLFAYWLLWSWEERALVPAILYRLERCDAGDQAALQYLAAILNAPLQYHTYDLLQAYLLGAHISLSELWSEPGPTLAELQEVVDGAVFSLAVGPRLRALYDDWPRYEPDALVGVFAPSDVPMLMQQGELDPATPAGPAAEVGAFYSGPNQQYFLIPRAPHDFNSPTPSGTVCSLSMMFFWVKDPSAPVYDCIGDILALDFKSTPQLAAYLGTADMWENQTSAALPPPPPPDLAGYRSFLRRHGR